MTFDDMIDMSIDNNGNVSTLGWNSALVNEALREATDRAEYFLYGMNKGQTLDVDDPNMTPVEFGDSVGDLAAKDPTVVEDRKSTRLNSSHVAISYAVFCLK